MKPARPEFVNNMTEIDAEFDTEALKKVCLRLERQRKFVDDAGYENMILAAAVHPEKDWIAWVESRYKVENKWIYAEFKLRELLDEAIIIEWEIETYNPAFGCYVHYLKWHRDLVLMIYSEKHRIFAATQSVSGAVNRLEIGSLGFPWGIFGNTIACRYYGESEVHCWSIPDLTPLPALTEEEALQVGILR